jgi:hypothetical protein
MKVPTHVLTEVERIVRDADAKGQGAGFSLTMTFPDGSRLTAPIYEVGPNWASLAELRDSPLMVDTLDATIEVDWSPGPSEASGPRFDYLGAVPRLPFS